jgi:hypothetical protein
MIFRLVVAKLVMLYRRPRRLRGLCRKSVKLMKFVKHPGLAGRILGG